jgi:hypothetical protein
MVQPWKLEECGRPSDWFFHIRITIEWLPHHAWSAEGVRQVLGDICVFDHMEDASFQQGGTSWFSFQAWMANPNLLPRTKTVTFFAERVDRSGVSVGPPSLSVSLPPPPKGIEVALLIHLDYYYDWTP